MPVKILFVEDSPRLQYSVGQALRKAGYATDVADNGGDWFVSGAPDPRWNDDRLRALKKVKGSDFEVVKMGKVVTK